MLNDHRKAIIGTIFAKKSGHGNMD
jgi:hypothetical protein